MALEQRELYNENALASALRFESYRQVGVTIAALTGAPVLPALTPMALDAATGHWVVWNNAGSPAGTDDIQGFLHPVASGEFEGEAGFPTSASDETIGVVILEGKFNATDIPLPSGESQPNLDAAIQALRTSQPLLRVQGLAGAV